MDRIVLRVCPLHRGIAPAVQCAHSDRGSAELVSAPSRSHAGAPNSDRMPRPANGRLLRQKASGGEAEDRSNPAPRGAASGHTEEAHR